MRFWDIHVVGYAMPSIRSLPPVEARAADAQQTCCFLLSDPRYNEYPSFESSRSHARALLGRAIQI